MVNTQDDLCSLRQWDLSAVIRTMFTLAGFFGNILIRAGLKDYLSYHAHPPFRSRTVQLPRIRQQPGNRGGVSHWIRFSLGEYFRNPPRLEVPIHLTTHATGHLYARVISDVVRPSAGGWMTADF